jgi:hypothetical protein
MPALDALTRYAPSAGRSARDINFENAVRFRAKKADADLLNPGMPSVNRAPGWDAFDGGLDRGAQDAGDEGMGFSVNMSGIGQPGGGSVGSVDPFGQTRRGIAGNMALGDYADRSKATALSMRALSAQARLGEDAAQEADWKDDPYQKESETEDMLKRAGSIGEFQRGQAVKDAANAGNVYHAGQPARRAAQYDSLQTAREMFPFGKESTELQKAQLEAGAKIREAETNRARERSQGLRSLVDLAKARTGVPQDVNDPSGATEGGFLGFGGHPKQVPNPAYDDLTDSMRAAYDVLQVPNPDAPQASGGKTMSSADLAAFAQQNRMTVQEAAALAQQHGWTVR